MKQVGGHHLYLHPFTEKPTRVNVLGEKKIGEGDFGEVYEVLVEIGRHRISAVIKLFRKKKDAKKAVKNYKRAKGAGLRVFPTYRPNAIEQSVLMTNGNSDKWICMGKGNDSLVANFHEERMGEIINFDVLIVELFEQAQRAAAHKIKIHADVLFFLFDRQKKVSIQFVLGDMDNLQKSDLPYERLLDENCFNIGSALNKFLGENVKPPYLMPYKERAAYFFNYAQLNFYEAKRKYATKAQE